MKQLIRAFAVGLLTAAVIMLIANYFVNGTKQDFAEMPVEDIINELKEKGYRVLDETEYISLSMKGEVDKKETQIASETEENSSEDNQEEVSDEVPDEKAEDDGEVETETESNDESSNQEASQDDETVKSYTLTIESGMPSSTISNELEANGIIDDSREFIRYLEQEGYAVRIQLGSFTLNSGMSYNEIAESLTK